MDKAQDAAQQPATKENWVRIGRVIKPHGIRGEVSVEVTTEFPAERFAPNTVLDAKQAGRWSQLTVRSLRPHQGRLLMTFVEIPDRTAAESLRGMNFFAPPLEDDEDEGFYDYELEGLAVVHEGAKIGVVTGVMHGPAGEILEVELSGGKPVLIPFVTAIVPEVDLEAGNLVITPPEGLLEL